MINRKSKIIDEDENFTIYEVSGQQYIDNVLFDVVYIEEFQKNSWESFTRLKNKTIVNGC